MKSALIIAAPKRLVKPLFKSIKLIKQAESNDDQFYFFSRIKTLRILLKMYVPKMKFSIKDFFSRSKCDQICSFLRI